MLDFTLAKYIELLKSLKSLGYHFQTFEEFLRKPKPNSIILRHDVDLLPYNSLRFAKIQSDLGIKGTYYFRAVPESWNDEVITNISKMGHEIGYHYECLTTCKGDLKESIRDFEKNLLALRELAPVSTICMHGSPMSKFDSKDLWKDHDYKDYDIIGEPYFDVNFNEVFYLTDTGRRWDGDKVSVRDRVETNFKNSYHSTQEIMDSLKKGEFPDQIMFTFHPQRWNDNLLIWAKEFLLQNSKNIVKRYLFVNKK